MRERETEKQDKKKQQMDISRCSNNPLFILYYKRNEGIDGNQLGQLIIMVAVTDIDINSFVSYSIVYIVLTTAVSIDKIDNPHAGINRKSTCDERRNMEM